MSIRIAASMIQFLHVSSEVRGARITRGEKVRLVDFGEGICLSGRGADRSSSRSEPLGDERRERAAVDQLGDGRDIRCQGAVVPEFSHAPADDLVRGLNRR